MTVVSMSNQEFSRLQVLLDVEAGRLRIEDAAQLIGLKRRQVFRLLKGIRKDGPAGLISKRRGRPSNHRLPPAYRELAMTLVRERYADFGPTLAAEKLTELHGFGVSRETLRHGLDPTVVSPAAKSAPILTRLISRGLRSGARRRGYSGRCVWGRDGRGNLGSAADRSRGWRE